MQWGNQHDRLDAYSRTLASLDPDAMGTDEVLAFWLNLYNAGALALAAKARAHGAPSVLRVPGAFDQPWAQVLGEALSMHDIEHGKIRRFGDPRIHGALACGTASRPTLRFEPYLGPKLDSHLDDQMRSFMASGGVTVNKAGSKLRLSRIFLWYGGDFTRPESMATWIPPRRSALIRALALWFDAEIQKWQVQAEPKVSFRPYGWELACSVA